MPKTKEEAQTEAPKDTQNKRRKKRKKRTAKKPVPLLKYTLKDSVFTFLFHLPEYIRLLYLTLHPEDVNVKETDCSAITLENVLVNGEYNDLGIMVRNRLVILVEAQSTFSKNIVLRLLLYVAETYRRFVDTQGWDLYSSNPVSLPRVELVVIYTGNKKNVPDMLHLSDLYSEPGASSISMDVKVLRWRGTGDVVDQYIRFSQIATQKEKQYGRTREAIDAIFAQCMEEGILVPFLQSREKEVRDIMISLYSEKRIQELHDNTVREEGRKAGLAEGRAEGRTEGRAEGLAEGHTKGLAEGHTKGLAEGRDERNTEVIMEMLHGNEPISKIMRYTQASMERISEIASSLGIAVMA